MKKLLFTALWVAVFTSTCFAQLSKVNQRCEQMPCESGLYCVTLKNGEKKCATCTQSTLDDLTDDVDDYCKGFESGWTPGASPEFNEALADDGRVWIDVYDIMIDKAKKCKETRITREDKCWDDGDDDHKRAINQVTESIEKMVNHKRTQIDDRRVYYCSSNTYESRLSTYNSKCKINLYDINQKVDIMVNAVKGGNKVDCDDLEDYNEMCEYCLEAAKNLLYDGFRNNSSYIPYDYNEVMNKAQETAKKGKDLLYDVKSKSLCD
jgi:hypothetical protein